MATKSALKTVYIKDAKSAGKLVRAMENAKGKNSCDVHMSRSVSTATKEDIRKIFHHDDRV